MLFSEFEFADVTLDSIVTPGNIDLGTGIAVRDITIACSFGVLGFPPSYEIVISSVTNNLKATFAQFDIVGTPEAVSNENLDLGGLTGTATLSIDFSSYPSGNYAINRSFQGSGDVYLDAGSFNVVALGPPGSSQNNPILPDSIDENGNFIFESIQGNNSFWMDPPNAFGDVYQTTNNALIKSLVGLPQGIDQDRLFTYYTNFQIFENVTVNHSVDFRSQQGGGIRWFTITDMGPVDASNTATLPIQLTFTETADLSVTSMKIPEITSISMELADSGDVRKPNGWYVDVKWTSQLEPVHILETFFDFTNRTTANIPIEEPWHRGNSMLAFTRGSSQFFRHRGRFPGPILKVDGGGPVVITPPVPKIYWPFGPPLPQVP